MTNEDSDLLLRLASRDASALADLYDRHARSVYGYALALTRRPREARRTLIRTYQALAKGPEQACAAACLRRHLLALARPIAWAERSRWRLRLPALPRGYALDPGSAPNLIAETNAARGQEAEESILMALEGIESLDRDEFEGPPPTPGSRGAWRSPPPSLRPLVLARAREAARPARRYARWLLSWALCVGALLLAVGSDSSSPRLPDVAYTPSEAWGGDPLREELRVRRHLHWILEGFRREDERR